MHRVRGNRGGLSAIVFATVITLPLCDKVGESKNDVGYARTQESEQKEIEISVRDSERIVFLGQARATIRINGKYIVMRFDQTEEEVLKFWNLHDPLWIKIGGALTTFGKIGMGAVEKNDGQFQIKIIMPKDMLERPAIDENLKKSPKKQIERPISDDEEIEV